MKLQEFIFPAMGHIADMKMFIKSSGGVLADWTDKSLTVPQGERVSYDTYFNSFFVERWGKYTVVSDLYLNVKFKGKGYVNIYNIISSTNKKLIFQKKISKEDMGEISLKVLDNLGGLQGIIYFEYIAEEESVIYGADFSTTAEPVRKISLGLAITTFRREEYVLNNIKIFEEGLFSRMNPSEVHVYVIDNGQTLSIEDNEYISLVPNGNFGGAGGFARGEMAIEDAGIHSHVVFCDDDAIYEPESFIRLSVFLSMAKDEDICVGGSMFSIDCPNTMYESGAKYRNGYLYSLKNNLQMNKWSDLYKLSVEEKAFSHAWWFFAFPCSFIKRFGYPMPFFFRGDDMEFSWRLREANIKSIDLNGICVWHEAFSKKSASSTDYYIARNESIMRLMHEKYVDDYEFTKKAMKSLLGSVAMYRYDRMKKIYDGYVDFMKGPKCLTEIDPPQFHLELLESQKEKAVPVDEDKIISEKYERDIYSSWLKKLIIKATLNGAFLPDIFINKYHNDDSKGFVLEPMYSNRVEAIFRKEVVLYLDVDSGVGYEVRLDKWRAVKSCVQACLLKRKIKNSLPKLAKEYKNAYEKFRTREFWESYLGMKGENVK